VRALSATGWKLRD